RKKRPGASAPKKYYKLKISLLPAEKSGAFLVKRQKCHGWQTGNILAPDQKNTWEPADETGTDSPSGYVCARQSSAAGSVARASSRRLRLSRVAECRRRAHRPHGRAGLWRPYGADRQRPPPHLQGTLR